MQDISLLITDGKQDKKVSVITLSGIKYELL